MKPTVVLQTDFGNGGGGVMAGVIRSVDPEVPVYDFDHFIEAFNTVAASASLSGAVPYWPSGTVFVSVVDPGVGTERRSCVAKLTNGSYIVTPDNGTLTMLKDMITEVRRIDESINRLPGSENCYIYHGRDVYSYTAARLASGVISYEEVGPEYPVSEIVTHTLTNVETVVRKGYAHGGFYDMEKAFGCLRVNITRIPEDSVTVTGSISSYATGINLSMTVYAIMTRHSDLLLKERHSYAEIYRREKGRH